jgi:hypothetical protein
MSKIFGTIAAVLIAASAFIAFKNKEAKADEDATYLQSQATQKTTTNELNKLIKKINDDEAETEEKLAAAAKLESELEVVNANHKEAKEKVAALKEQFESKEGEIAKADEALNSLPDPKVLIPKIKRMRKELDEAVSLAATKETQLANLSERDENGKKRIDVTRKLTELQSSGKSFPTLKTRISSIYRNWGFVTLAAGDRQGVVTGSVLDVVRQGEVVAKLRVTAVEAGTASADIVLDSVTAGITLQSGDTVLPEREAQPAVTTASK